MTYWRQLKQRGTHDEPPQNEEKRSPKVAMGYDIDRSRDQIECLTTAIAARGTHKTARDPLAAAYAEGDTRLFPPLARACLRAAGRDCGLLSDAEAIHLANTTSDYPVSIGSVVAKALLPAYQHARPAYRRTFARRDLKDFHATDMTRPADFPVPQRVAEGGEVKLGSFTESGETATLASYRSGIAISRQLQVNDEVGVVGGLATGAGLRCADLEDSIAFAVLTSGANADGPTMRDGGQLCSIARGNKASSGAVISATTISTGRAALANATSPDGTKSVATARYLVCPPSLLTLAEIELAKLNPGADPDQRITPIASPNLTGTAWYLFADPALPALVYSYMAGASGPIVVAASDWETDGIAVQVTLDFAVTAVDPRGVWKNPGA